MDATLISNPSDNQWVVEITKILDHQIEINREFPSVSIFELPEPITTKKPEAYEPQQLGLGPIHHFRPGPYRNMEQQKLLVARKGLQEIKEEDGKLIVLNKVRALVPIVRELVPVVRSCYNIFLTDDDETLAMIFTIDGLFLHDLFQTYNIGMGEKEAYLRLLKEKACEYKGGWLAMYGPTSEELESRGQTIEEFAESCTRLPDLLRQKEIVVTSKNRTEFEDSLDLPRQQFQRPKFGTRRRNLVQDIMMVANQIPFIVLKEIKEGLHPSSGSFSPSEFRTFCKIHSPLKLCLKRRAPTNDVHHVLHYLYYSIINNYIIEMIPARCSAPMVIEENSCRILEQASNVIINPIRFISKVPSEEIVQGYEKFVSILESFTQSKVLIPSASKLHDKAGFNFHGLPKHQGIQNIHNKKIDIYLPCVTLNNDSEVILRNLVAYETLTASNPDKFLLTEYMGLMCALIENVNDVQYLRDQKVIDGNMGNDEVAKLFIGMSTSIQPVKTKEKSKLQKVIDEVNIIYNNRLEMKIYLLMKKLARWLLVGLKSIGKFVEYSWKIVAFMIGIVTVFMLTYQAYCDVYGCDKKTVASLPYASS